MKLNIDSYEMITKDIDVKGKFINRELSWLDFNARVLNCALAKIPLNERLNFLGITTSNLDEFISVRFAYVIKNKNKEPYKDILKQIHRFIKNQVTVYNDLIKDVKDKGYEITKASKLDKKEYRKIRQIFRTSIFPLLTPILVSDFQDIHNISSGDNCIAVEIKQNLDNVFAIIPIPRIIDPIYQIGDKVVYVEDIIREFLDELFINKEIKEHGVFRFIKDASFCLSHDDSRFVVDRMNDIIQMRKTSKPIFIETESKMSDRLINMITERLGVPKTHVHVEETLVDYRRFSKIKILPDKYSYKPFKPKPYEGKGRYSIFSVIDEKDILLHHPYDSYDTVVRFINHAAIDPDVVAIKQTLYRVSSIDSPIVNGLCKAAENGKHVSVLVEIKARFDEQNNIHVINKLKSSGCHILLGTEFLKTHCKMCVVIKKDEDTYKIYSHIATGNYNEKTSKIYTDLSYFTSKRKIGFDLLNIFNILSGISTPDSKLQKIAYSPVTLRKTLIKCIDREIENAKRGKKSGIFIKVNSISDPIIVQKLYDAASKGVKIYIICRGICSIVSKKNIYIKSIVGRFLEHSRIYYFYNNNHEEYYISSADLLTRNLDRRIEILLSLTDSNVIHKIKDIIRILKKDEANSFVMDEYGVYHRMKGNFNAHEKFITL